MTKILKQTTEKKSGRIRFGFRISPARQAQGVPSHSRGTDFGFSRRGFTLIELMVVVFILGILATMVAFAVSKSRTAARDARRKADVKTFQTSFELYFNVNNRYPPYASNIAGGWEASIRSDTDFSRNPQFLSVMAPNYLQSAVYDPINDQTHSYFFGANDRDVGRDGTIDSSLPRDVGWKFKTGCEEFGVVDDNNITTNKYRYFGKPGYIIVARVLENTTDTDREQSCYWGWAPGFLISSPGFAPNQPPLEAKQLDQD